MSCSSRISFPNSSGLRRIRATSLAIHQLVVALKRCVARNVQRVHFGNMRPTALVPILSTILPPGWTAALAPPPSPRADGLLSITAPDGTRGRFFLEVKPRLSAADARRVAPLLRGLTESASADAALILTRFLTPLARSRLQEEGISFADETGNMRIQLDRPAVLIEREGMRRDPNPLRAGLRSLKGSKAARLVRALIDWAPPVGVRELARRAGADPGYATRVLTLLEGEDVIVRDGSGTIIDVRWLDLLRRWAQDYSVSGTNRAFRFLAPRGPEWVRERLHTLSVQYAITGVAAVPRAAQTIPSQLSTLYVRDAPAAAQSLDLRVADAEGNMVLLEPPDSLPFERARRVGELQLVAFSQCAVDLLTGPGRDPSQGEALIEWMALNEGEWRA